jgi:hypothetical protein
MLQATRLMLYLTILWFTPEQIIRFLCFGILSFLMYSCGAIVPLLANDNLHCMCMVPFH